MKNYKWLICYIILIGLTILLFMAVNYNFIQEINKVTYLYENEMWVELISYLTKSHRG